MERKDKNIPIPVLRWLTEELASFIASGDWMKRVAPSRLAHFSEGLVQKIVSSLDMKRVVELAKVGAEEKVATALVHSLQGGIIKEVKNSLKDPAIRSFLRKRMLSAFEDFADLQKALGKTE